MTKVYLSSALLIYVKRLNSSNTHVKAAPRDSSPLTGAFTGLLDGRRTVHGVSLEPSSRPVSDNFFLVVYFGQFCMYVIGCVNIRCIIVSRPNYAVLVEQLQPWTGKVSVNWEWDVGVS